MLVQAPWVLGSLSNVGLRNRSCGSRDGLRHLLHWLLLLMLRLLLLKLLLLDLLLLKLLLLDLLLLLLLLLKLLILHLLLKLLLMPLRQLLLRLRLLRLLLVQAPWVVTCFRSRRLPLLRRRRWRGHSGRRALSPAPRLRPRRKALSHARIRRSAFSSSRNILVNARSRSLRRWWRLDLRSLCSLRLD